VSPPISAVGSTGWLPCAGNGSARTPLGGAIFVFRNRRASALKLLCYDGQRFWLCHKRLSQGRLKWWPSGPQARVTLSARELQILLWNGNPKALELAEDWRRVA